MRKSVCVCVYVLFNEAISMHFADLQWNAAKNQ